MKSKNNPTSFKGYWVVRDLTSGTVYCDINGRYFFANSNSELSKSTYNSESEAVEGYYIEEACSRLGSAIRDNSRAEKILMGKKLDEGTWQDEAA